VTGGWFDGDKWCLKTSRGERHGNNVINCAGLFGDRLHQLLGGKPEFSIRPRKGQFVVYDKSARGLTRSILLPVPTPITKGIVVCPTVFGNLLVGPTAEEQKSRIEAGVDEAALGQLRRHGERILPGLRGHGITAVYAGLRPATEDKDYRVLSDPARNYLCLGGIRSTGLSAALGIAQHAYRIMQSSTRTMENQSPVRWPAVPNISEHGTRDWMRAGNDGIVCHCELVTRREILQALDGPTGATTLAGLKRRTRVTMGRCQGFYCTAELGVITADRLAVPLLPDQGGAKK
jgi:glycerol-3-phosphate dehydrogenase